MLISYIKKLLLRLSLRRKAILRARWIYKLVGNRPSRKTGGKTEEDEREDEQEDKQGDKVNKDNIIEYTILDD